jgi:ketosteroid isomerase-like protein
MKLPAWASTAGIVDVGLAEPLTVDAVADRMLIVERLHRYCWGFDERNLEALTDCFTEDAVWEGNVTGTTPIGPMTGRDNVIHWLTNFWPHQHDQRRHVLTNCVVERQTTDEAVASAYLLLLASTGTKAALETTGLYVTTLRRAGSKWQITRMVAGFDAPFWPGKLEELSDRGRVRHGIRTGRPPT